MSAMSNVKKRWFTHGLLKLTNRKAKKRHSLNKFYKKLFGALMKLRLISLLIF